MKRSAAVALFLLVCMAGLTAFSTQKAVGSGTKHFWKTSPLSTPQRIMGQAADELGIGGYRHISIATNSAGSAAWLRLAIYSSSIVGGVDTLSVMGAWDGSFATGVDSVVIITANASAQISVVGSS